MAHTLRHTYSPRHEHNRKVHGAWFCAPVDEEDRGEYYTDQSSYHFDEARRRDGIFVQLALPSAPHEEPRWILYDPEGNLMANYSADRSLQKVTEEIDKRCPLAPWIGWKS